MKSSRLLIFFSEAFLVMVDPSAYDSISLQTHHSAGRHGWLLCCHPATTAASVHPPTCGPIPRRAASEVLFMHTVPLPLSFLLSTIPALLSPLVPLCARPRPA